MFSISDYDSADLLATKNAVVNALRRFASETPVDPGHEWS